MAKKKETAPPLSPEEQKKVDLEAAKVEFHKALLYAQKIAQRNISNPASSRRCIVALLTIKQICGCGIMCFTLLDMMSLR